MEFLGDRHCPVTLHFMEERLAQCPQKPQFRIFHISSPCFLYFLKNHSSSLLWMNLITGRFGSQLGQPGRIREEASNPPGGRGVRVEGLKMGNPRGRKPGRSEGRVLSMPGRVSVLGAFQAPWNEVCVFSHLLLLCL